MGGSIVIGVPLYRWMFYKGKSQSKVDDDSGYPYDLGNLHMVR